MHLRHICKRICIVLLGNTVFAITVFWKCQLKCYLWGTKNIFPNQVFTLIGFLNEKNMRCHLWNSSGYVTNRFNNFIFHCALFSLLLMTMWFEIGLCSNRCLTAWNLDYDEIWWVVRLPTTKSYQTTSTVIKFRHAWLRFKQKNKKPNTSAKHLLLERSC